VVEEEEDEAAFARDETEGFPLNTQHTQHRPKPRKDGGLGGGGGGGGGGSLYSW